MGFKRENKLMGPSQRGGLRDRRPPKIKPGTGIFRKGSLQKGLGSKRNKN